MTIVGDVHYYVVKAKIDAQKTIGIKPKGKLKNIMDMIVSDKPVSDTLQRSKSIVKKYKQKAQTADESNKPGIIPYFNLKPYEHEKEGQLKIFIRPEAYEQEGKRTISIDASAINRRKSFDDAHREEPSTTTINQKQRDPFRYRNIRSVGFQNNNPTGLTMEQWLQSKHSPVEISFSPRKRKEKEVVVKINTYYAHYYASDDDFLMFSHVRKFFKKNVLDSSDSILFAIQDSTVNTGEEHPMLENLAFLMGDDNLASPIFTVRLKVFIVLFGIASFVVVKFLSNYMLISSSTVCFCSWILYVLLPLFDYNSVGLNKKGIFKFIFSCILYAPNHI
jgi:hypothetical protein